MDVADEQLLKTDDAIDLIEKEVKACNVAGAKAKMLRTLRELLEQRKDLIDVYQFNTGPNLCDRCKLKGYADCNKPSGYFIYDCDKFDTNEETEASDSKDDDSDGE
jgi:hypothetical protein